MTNILLTKQTNTKPIAIKNVPEHWGISRAKNIFYSVDERSSTGKEELLSVSHITGVTPRSEKNINMFLAESYEGYKLCKPRDLVVNSLWVWMKALGFSEYEGIVSTAYGVYRLKNETLFNYKYLDYLLRSDFYGGEYLIRSKGIWTSRLLLSDDSFFNIPIVVPPRYEQDAIVKFLDEKISDIDEYILAKQKLIALLEEKKVTIINNAVTKGIDPNGNMKDSGNKYIGEIPKSWQIRKLKFLAEVIFSNVDKHSLVEELKIYLCNYVDVYKNDFIDSSIDFMKASASEFEIDKFSLKKDDVIVTKDSETYEDIAKPAIIIESLQNVICGYHLAIIRAKSELIIPRFLFYLFKSFDFNKQFAIKANGITRYGLSQLAIKDAIIVFPSVLEQKKIVSLIEYKSRKIDQQISSLQNQISLINEYKNSLIAEAITGIIKLTSSIFEIRIPQNPYFARTVLSAEIISQLYQSPTFGHTKFVKLLFLIEKLAVLDIKTKYYRQAAGPYDNVAIRSIDKQLEEHKWFKTVNENGRIKYEPLEKAGEHSLKFQEYYGDKRDIVEFIINTFRNARTIQCEIVATLYSAWDDLCKENSNATDNEIINEVLNNWHESKKRIPKERWLKALIWMKEKNIVPSI